MFELLFYIIATETKKEIPKEKFFRGISDFKSVKIDQSLMNEDRKLQRELAKKKNERKSAGKRQNTQSITYVVKKTGKKKIAKKVGVKSTMRK